MSCELEKSYRTACVAFFSEIPFGFSAAYERNRRKANTFVPQCFRILDSDWSRGVSFSIAVEKDAPDTRIKLKTFL